MCGKYIIYSPRHNIFSLLFAVITSFILRILGFGLAENIRIYRQVTGISSISIGSIPTVCITSCTLNNSLFNNFKITRRLKCFKHLSKCISLSHGNEYSYAFSVLIARSFTNIGLRPMLMQMPFQG